MTDAQPTLMPGGIETATTQSRSSSHIEPNQLPPAFATSELGAMHSGGAMQAQAVSSPPPSTQAPTLPTSSTSMGTGIAAWQNNKRIDALWTINEDRNSWIGVTGIGWRKLAPGNETSLSAMTMLAAHARSSNAVINYRDEADNLVHEIYVW